jgi:hypothetical protein
MEEIWLGNSRENLASMEASYKLTLEEIERAGPAKAWGKRKRGMGRGSDESLIDEKRRKGEEIQSLTEGLRRCEEERDAILAEIAVDEEKLNKLNWVPWA